MKSFSEYFRELQEQDVSDKILDSMKDRANQIGHIKPKLMKNYDRQKGIKTFGGKHLSKQDIDDISKTSDKTLAHYKRFYKTKKDRYNKGHWAALPLITLTSVENHIAHELALKQKEKK